MASLIERSMLSSDCLDLLNFCWGSAQVGANSTAGKPGVLGCAPIASHPCRRILEQGPKSHIGDMVVITFRKGGHSILSVYGQASPDSDIRSFTIE